jgi:predicted transposase/invertase (TIGR01784 family)
VLIEHQSTVDTMIAFRLWHYIFAAWHQFITHNPKAKKLPLIVPILLYQGTAGHTAALDIRKLIDAPPELVDEVFAKHIHLIDLHRISDEKLKEQVETSAFLLTMKHIKDEIVPIEFLFREVSRISDQRSRVDLTELVVTLLLFGREDVTIEIILDQTAEILGPHEKEAIMTGAEQLERKAQKKIAQRMLEKGASIEFILDTTDLSLDEVRKLQERKSA